MCTNKCSPLLHKYLGVGSLGHMLKCVLNSKTSAFKHNSQWKVTLLHFFICTCYCQDHWKCGQQVCHLNIFSYITFHFSHG